MGAIARHGAHQVAQKSTSTGIDDSRTSRANDSSLTATAFTMGKPPFLTVLDAAILAMQGGQERMRRVSSDRNIGGSKGPVNPLGRPGRRPAPPACPVVSSRALFRLATRTRSGPRRP